MSVASCTSDSIFRSATNRDVVNVTLALPRQRTPLTGYVDVRRVARRALRGRSARVSKLLCHRKRKLPDPAHWETQALFRSVLPSATPAVIERHPSCHYDSARPLPAGGRWLSMPAGARSEYRFACWTKNMRGAGKFGGASGAEILSLALKCMMRCARVLASIWSLIPDHLTASGRRSAPLYWHRYFVRVSHEQGNCFDTDAPSAIVVFTGGQDGLVCLPRQIGLIQRGELQPDLKLKCVIVQRTLPRCQASGGSLAKP